MLDGGKDCQEEGTRSAIRLALDCDNAFPAPAADVDDALALVLALVQPGARLAAVTACAGNCETAESARRSRILLDLAGREDIPVDTGRERPFLADRRAHHRYLEEKSKGPDAALWENAGTRAPFWSGKKPRFRGKAHARLIREAKRRDGPLSPVLTGSLTNLGLALLAAPEIAPRLGRAVHMGGAFGRGNAAFSTPDIPDAVWRDVLRFNTLYDPHAASVVFESGLDLTMVPVNVTGRIFLRPEHARQLEGAVTPLGRALFPGVAAWLAFSMKRRGLPGAHMHDPAALAALLHPEWFELALMRVDMDRLFAGDNAFLTEKGKGPEVKVAVSARIEAVEDWIARGLARAARGDLAEDAGTDRMNEEQCELPA